MMAEKAMANQSREAFEKWAGHCGLFQKTHGPIGNRAYDSSYTEEHWETWQAALSEGRRQEREEIALDSLETKYSYTEILQMAAEAIKRIPGKGIVGGGEVTNG